MMMRTARFGCGLAGALMLCQAPEVMQQYQQRLGGAVDELRLIAERFDHDARYTGLTREEALQKYRGSSDAFFRERGKSIFATLVRYEHLRDHRGALQSANVLERPVLFLREADETIREGTLAEFKPAVPTTLEGAIYGALGFLAGSGLFGLFGAAMRLLRRMTRLA